MSYQEKNITGSLISFSLILGYFLIRVLRMTQTETFLEENVFRLWVIVIVLAIVVTIVGTVIAHIISAIVEAVTTGNENPEIEDIADERDKLIDLRGTRVTHSVASSGVFVAMLSFALSQPPLVMFTLLIFFGLTAQVAGDFSRLLLYRRGF